MVRQDDDPFVCLGAKPDKGFGLEISDETESGVGKAGSREAREAVSVGWRKGAVDNRQQKRPVGWDRVQEQYGRQARWVRSPESTTVSSEEEVKDELAFLVACRNFAKKYTSASVDRCTGNAVSLNYPYCTLSWPKPILFVCSLFFFSHSLGCISCGRKEMWDTPAVY